jgi:hypothetical protein
VTPCALKPPINREYSQGATIMPDTTAYLFLGLIVVFAILGLFLASLYMRFQSTRKDIVLLESLRDE